jgi:hypothetical protein
VALFARSGEDILSLCNQNINTFSCWQLMSAIPSLIISPHVLERVFGFLSSLADIASVFVVNKHWNSVVRNGVYKCLERQRWIYAFLNNCLRGKNWMDIDWEKEFSM